MSTQILQEKTNKPTKTESQGIWRVRLIEADVQGSSGFYPASVIERDISKAFPKGTHVYLDHPTFEEEMTRPERSVRDLAGVLVEDAHYEEGADGRGGFGRVQIKPDFREDMEFLAEHTGFSIRAIGVTEESPSTGIPIVQEIIEGLSVDIVTHAGAGGKAITMTESKNTQTSLFTDQDKQSLNTLFQSINETKEAVQSLNAAISEMREQAKKTNTTTTTESAPTALSPAEIVSKLDESDLPKASRKRVAQTYKAGDDLDQMIQDEKALVAEIAESQNKQTNTTTTNNVGTVNESTDTSKNFDDLMKTLYGGV